MKNIRNIAVTLAWTIFGLVFPLLCHGQGFELPCAAGSSPLPNGVTYNPTTQMQRAWVCANANGIVTSPVFASTGGGVTSFNTRTGAVVPVLNDYSFSLLSGTLSTSQVPTGGSSTLFLNASGTYTAPSVSSLPFSSLTTGANTTAAFGIASGGSLSTSGTGTINCTTLTTGDNTTACATDAFVNASIAATSLNATVNLTSAQILLLATTPIVIIPAVAGKIIVVDRVEYHYTNGGINYATSSSFALIWQGSSNVVISETAFSAAGGFGNGATNGFANQINGGAPTVTTAYQGSSNTANLINIPVSITATANPTLGNGTVVVVVYYHLVTF